MSTQTLRLRRPENTKPTVQASRHSGILQDQLRRSTRRPWTPSFSLAVRILMLVRVTGAMYSNMDDCDEVYNFWEPLHFLDQGYGFQTWEVSPIYAIRSWSYITLHLFPARVATFLLGSHSKRIVFFAVRAFLALICVLCEAKFYRTVHGTINERVGRYLFFMLLCSAGMWNASTALLPSSFAMYTTMAAFSYALTPPSSENNRRTFFATLLFATGGIVGWPFSLALAIPFVLEEFFILGTDRVAPEVQSRWRFTRWKRFFTAGATASLLFVPVIGIDSYAYGRLAIVPWNIIRYNIFGGNERGPDLYGTSPWTFYFLNLVLNFNVLVPLALLALPSLAVTYKFDPKRLGFVKSGPDQSSPFTILTFRLLPFYVWLGILTSQAHKEERFMFPVYPLLCFNAAVTLYLMRGWVEVVFISMTKSPYRASQSPIFKNFTFSVVVASSLISLSRILALWNYYHAPMSIMHNFEVYELPRLLNVTGLLSTYAHNVDPDHLPQIDLSPIKEFNLRLCIAKEWHRFPGHYLVPDGVRVDFVKSDFNGLLPTHFSDRASERWWSREGMRLIPDGLNDLNQEEPQHYVHTDTCDYLVDLDFPHHPISSPLEPRYAVDNKTWERVSCVPFLDARHSPLLTRTVWVPGGKWQNLNEYGDYCLLKNRALVGRKEKVARNIDGF